MIELSCDKMIRSLGVENLEWNRSEITFSRYTQIIDLLTNRARNKLFRVLSVFGCYLWTGRCLTSGKMIKIRPPRCVYNAVCSQNRVISFSVVFRCALLQIKKKKNWKWKQSVGIYRNFANDFHAISPGHDARPIANCPSNFSFSFLKPVTRLLFPQEQGKTASCLRKILFFSLR